ncbi:MAG: hypothetical protein KIH69_005145 [Anaerolineae bacterium]|nr:hypothetical protein [Anaerolineae bacterium]
MRGKLFVLWLGVFALTNAARAILSVQQAVQLPDLPTQLPPLYVAVTSVPWAVYFAICTWGALRRRAWIWRASLGGMAFYLAHQWLNRLAFSRSSEAFQTLGALAITSLAALIITFGLGWLNRRKIT